MAGMGYVFLACVILFIVSFIINEKTRFEDLSIALSAVALIVGIFSLISFLCGLLIDHADKQDTKVHVEIVQSDAKYIAKNHCIADSVVVKYNHNGYSTVFYHLYKYIK